MYPGYLIIPFWYLQTFLESRLNQRWCCVGLLVIVLELNQSITNIEQSQSMKNIELNQSTQNIEHSLIYHKNRC
jgi:hypothetical protein